MMKKKALYLIISLILTAARPAISQNVLFNAYFDSLNVDTKEMLIGEHARLMFELSVDSGYNVEIPTDLKMLAPGVEVLGSKVTKSNSSNGRNIFNGEYTITAFEDVLYAIPPLTATINGDTYYTNATNLLVNTVPIDTANLKKINEFRPIWGVSLAWSDVKDTVYLSLITIIILAFLSWIIYRYVKNKPIIRIVRIKPERPSHFVALEKINEIKSKNLILEEGNAKDYYTKLTDALREYMQRRFKFNATDMTTSEIIQHLLDFNDKEAIKDVKEMLEVADLVKFAKMQPSLRENERNMLSAIDFVNATKDIEEENKKPVERTIVNERSLKQKHLLLGIIATLSLALVATVAYLIIDLGNMFS